MHLPAPGTPDKKAHTHPKSAGQAEEGSRGMAPASSSSTLASPSVMDTTGLAQVGKYGTLSLLKSFSANQQQQGPSHAVFATPTGAEAGETVITSFGIDTEELTFGRDPDCSVRLYYPDVAVVHCKIIFEERKAFLAVLGESGLVVDGCEVYPNKKPAGSAKTIPLSNNSEFEIHGKRFRFAYPPKDMRAMLFAAPSPQPNRKLRLSMIHSAQVFSPRPSADPRENLKVLQSPLKNRLLRSPSKTSALALPPLTANGNNDTNDGSPTPRSRKQKQPAAADYVLENGEGEEGEREPDDSDEDEDEDEGTFVLVDGNHPRVVQEDKDLVILEDVEIVPPHLKTQMQAPTQTQTTQNQTGNTLGPRTPPRRKSMGGNALHRAVLIRSAHRAVMRAEEEEEEREVLETVVGVSEFDDEDSGGEERRVSDGNVELEDVSEDASNEDDDYDDEEEEEADNDKPLWRKSLAKIWPFNSGDRTSPERHSADGDEGGKKKDNENEDEDEDEDGEFEDQPAPLPSILQTPPRRQLGSFLTPQFRHQSPQSNHLFNNNKDSAAGRYSLGGAEARRVLVEQPWRVKDLVVPRSPQRQQQQLQTPTTANNNNNIQTPRRAPPTEEERRAIQERRRSALREPDNFFVGGVPGLSPSKPSKPGVRAANGGSPIKPSVAFAGRLLRTSNGGDDEGAGIGAGIGVGEGNGRRRTSGEEEGDLDTRSLLEKMRETVEGMKRRRSVVGGGAFMGTPVRAADGVGMMMMTTPRVVEEVEVDGRGRDDDKEEQEEVEGGNVQQDEKEEEKEEADKDKEEEETFSLLRPEARKSLAPLFGIPTIAIVQAEPVVDVSSPLLLDEQEEQEQEEEIVEAPKPRGRPRLLRATAATTTAKPTSKGKSTELKVVQIKERSRSGSATPREGIRRSPRPRTPQPEEEEEVPAVKKPVVILRSRKNDAADSTPPIAAVASGGSKRSAGTRKAPAAQVKPAFTVEDEKEKGQEEGSEDSEPPLPPPTRRGGSRKPVSSSEASTSMLKQPVERKTTTTTTTRAKAAKDGAVVIKKEVEGEGKVVVPVPAVKRAGRKPVVSEDSGEDAPVRKGRGVATTVAAAARKRVVVKTVVVPTAKGRGKKKAAEVEDEEEEEGDVSDEDVDAEEEVQPEPKAKRTAAKVTPKSRAAAAAKAKAIGTKTPAVRAVATRRGVKTPASAPAAVMAEDLDNKENEDEKSEVGEEVVKVKVSRSTRARAATTGIASGSSGAAKTKAVKTEEEEAVVVVAPRTRMVRSRARTKTG